MTYTLGQISEKVGGRVVGDSGLVITGVGTLANAAPEQIAFLTNSRYRKQLDSTRAGAVICTEADAQHYSGNTLVTEQPYVLFARITALFAAPEHDVGGRHPTAVIAESARVHDSVSVGPGAVIGENALIGENVVVGSGCFIGDDCQVGADSRLMPNVTLYHGTRVGCRALIHSGAVVGSDGFGFASENGRWIKIHQLGRVVIGDDVEIGANTTVDRGAIEDTVIEDGVKLDNLIQVAHNVHIGAHTAVAGCVGIAGSAKIGRHCAIGGGAGILGHLEIVDGVTITPMSFVTKSIKTPGVYSSGVPLEPSEQWQKNFVRFKQLDDMARRIKQLEKELQTLKRG